MASQFLNVSDDFNHSTIEIRQGVHKVSTPRWCLRVVFAMTGDGGSENLVSMAARHMESEGSGGRLFTLSHHSTQPQALRSHGDSIHSAGLDVRVGFVGYDVLVDTA
jgi:hypothetical protein